MPTPRPGGVREPPAALPSGRLSESEGLVAHVGQGFSPSLRQWDPVIAERSGCAALGDMEPQKP